MDSFELVFIATVGRGGVSEDKRCILFFIYLPSEDVVAPTDDDSESSYW